MAEAAVKGEPEGIGSYAGAEHSVDHIARPRRKRMEDAAPGRKSRSDRK